MAAFVFPILSALGVGARIALPRIAEGSLKHGVYATGGFAGAKLITDAASSHHNQRFDPFVSKEGFQPHAASPLAQARSGKIINSPSASYARETPFALPPVGGAVHDLFGSATAQRFQQLPDFSGRASGSYYPAAQPEIGILEGYRAHNAHLGQGALEGYFALDPAAISATSKPLGGSQVDSGATRLPPKAKLEGSATWDRPLEARWLDWFTGKGRRADGDNSIHQGSIKDLNPVKLSSGFPIGEIPKEWQGKTMEQIVAESPRLQRLELEVTQHALDTHDSRIAEAIARHNEDMALLQKVLNVPLKDIPSVFNGDAALARAYNIDRAFVLRTLHDAGGDEAFARRLGSELDRLDAERVTLEKRLVELKAQLNMK